MNKGKVLTPAKAKDATPTVAFRVPQTVFHLLEKEGAAIGMTAQAYARRLVILTLNDAERLNLKDAMLELQGEVRRQREDFAKAVEALLVDAGKVEPEDAADWVLEHLQERE
jgi:capsid portal protein